MSAFIVWAVVAACLAFWGLRLFVRAAPVPAHATAVSTAQAARGDIARLFADPMAPPAMAAQPSLASRFKLLGVMAPKPGQPSQAGVALIAVDDKPPRAFTIGARLDKDLVLQTVSLRSASIGPAAGAPAVVLELPPLPAPATGTLPAPGAPGASAQGPMPSVTQPAIPAPMPTPMPMPAPPVQVPGLQAPNQQPSAAAPLQPPTAIDPMMPAASGNAPQDLNRARQR